MRIIAGTLGGRLFNAPKNRRTHPMSDRVRGGLFNTLGDITGLKVLDCYAGSGALGFEAFSRGAKEVIAIESDVNAGRCIIDNAKTLGVSETYSLVKTSVQVWCTTNPRTTFDIVLCDPPYDHLSGAVLKTLASHVSNDGLLVLSWPGRQTAPILPGLDILRTASYGDAQLIFYRKVSN